jgi:membrane associated rhomboid family serine protease
MLALFVFGSMLENMWGAKRFLIFYLVCAFGASLLHSGVQFIEIQRLANFIDLYNQNPTPLGFEAFLQKYPAGNILVSPDAIEKFLEYPTNPELINYSKNVAQATYNIYHNIPMFGASGAIFGILAAFALIFPNLELMLLFPPIPVKAKYMIGVYILIEIYRMVANKPDDNVAHLAHLGGALFGYIMLRIWYGNNYRQY